jgi:hypothetical protein
MLLFFVVADAVDDDVVDCIVDDYSVVYYPLSNPWERGSCYVVLLLIVGRWSLIAVKSGPTPLFIAKH